MLRRRLALLVSVTTTGCASATAPDATTDTNAAIIDGTPATDYPEAVLINTERFYCSGALIAPRVVLTAGHCSRGASEWLVIAPYAGGQRVTTRRKWTEYVSHHGGPFVNPSSVDVGLLLLDTPIDLPFYPAIASAPVPAGTRAINVGRVQNGEPSNTKLYFGREVPLADGAPAFPLAYASDELIQPGDSGGPAYARGADGVRSIVAVNSGAGEGTQILARVDLMKEKIDAIVAANPPAASGAAPLDR